MNAIIGMTNIVKRKLGEDNNDDSEDMKEVKGHIRQIEESSRHLLGLLNDILDISKIEAGKIDLSEDTVELYKLAATVSSIIKPRCDEKNITFGAFLDTFTPPWFLCDSLRLRQVLINLLGNAVKFTPDYGRVEFRVEKKDQKNGLTLVEFSVRDTGIGISEERLKTIFQPFEQESGSVTRQYGGTGLGLSISKRIVELFGGEIAVKSKKGEGSEFSFSIWLTETVPDLPTEEIEADATGKFIGKRALLVDDVAINRFIVMSLLENTGMEIDEADDGLSAVKAFEKSPENTYDIIFMDVQMPNMDGYEAAAAIRVLPRADARRVPIVALTANAFKEDIDKALQHGMTAHIAKPVELDKLLEISFRFLSVRPENKQEEN
jgi:CheY-like chemotaxis protein